MLTIRTQCYWIQISLPLHEGNLDCKYLLHLLCQLGVHLLFTQSLQLLEAVEAYLNSCSPVMHLYILFALLPTFYNIWGNHVLL